MKAFIDVEVTATIPVEVTEEQFTAIDEAGTVDFEELEELGVTIREDDVMCHATYTIATCIERVDEEEGEQE